MNFQPFAIIHIDKSRIMPKHKPKLAKEYNCPTPENHRSVANKALKTSWGKVVNETEILSLGLVMKRKNSANKPSQFLLQTLATKR